MQRDNPKLCLKKKKNIKKPQQQQQKEFGILEL